MVKDIVALLGVACAAVVSAAEVKPAAKLVEWADCEIGVIIHQDVQVYAPDYDGAVRKERRTPPASVFAPTALDTDQWLAVAKSAGAKYAVLVVKHCSGFCLWPTKLHGYSVASSPWKAGKGDVAADFVASCRKYGIRPGFYYSVGGNEHFGVDSSTQKDEKRWNEYLAMVKGQLTELWSGYGPLFEIWFDGGNLPPEKGGREIEDLLVKLQPGAVVFQGNPARMDCVRWVGNERAHASEICWNRTDAGTGSDGMEERTGELYSGRFDGRYWVPGEADTPNRDNQHSFQGGWMWRAGQDDLVFPAEVLLDRYFTSVGRGCNLLIGMAIDDRGLVPDADAAQFRRFGELVGALYSRKVASASGKGMCFFLEVPEGRRPDLLSVSEDLTTGENIHSYSLSGFDGKSWHLIVSGNNVGHRHLDRFRAGAYTRFRFDCWDARPGTIPVLREIALYETPKEIPAVLKAGESRVIDFGPDGVGGYPCVDFRGTDGEATVRLAYSTHPDGLGEKGDFWHETRANYMGDAVWLPILPANTDRYDVFRQKGAGVWRAPLAQGLVRYLKLTVESGAADIRAVRLVNDGIHSEKRPVCAFSCSDERVNGVWAASVRTCQLASVPARTNSLSVCSSRTNAVLGVTHAYLSDGAKRDRLVWSGDLWFAQRNMYTAFDPSSPYMAGSLRMLFENRTPEGYVQACPYPESHGPLKAGEYGPFASDEFAAWFVPVLHDHVLYTGDLALGRELFGAVRDLVAYLRRHTAPDGIFEQRLETSKHSCGLAVGGTSTHHRAYMNILLWLVYRDAAELARWLGDEASRAAWDSLADATAVAVRRAFWNPEKGHFRLSREDGAFGFEANALALAARFASREEAVRILPQLDRHWHGKFQLLAVRGAFAYGDGEKAMALVGGHNWYRILSPEWKGLRTIQECDNLCTKGWGDEAHPDACPGGDLVEGLLGIRPLEPGYRTFCAEPVPSAAIRSAEGRVPTPYGFIEVSWTRGEKGLELTVCNPPGTRRVDAKVDKGE